MCTHSLKQTMIHHHKKILLVSSHRVIHKPSPQNGNLTKDQRTQLTSLYKTMDELFHLKHYGSK
jgi:hypothetical protein